MAGFGLEHLPYGVVAPGGADPRPAVRLDDGAVDLRALARSGALPEAGEAFEAPVLNAFLRLGPRAWAATRRRLTALAPAAPRLPLADVEERLPIAVGDYVDFYSSIEHATTVGRLFRPDGDPLPPAWRHLPIGYHGRAGTVVVSGTPVPRPSGQLAPGEFGPEPRLDFELELAVVTGEGPVPFGVALLNDWSARAIQRFEYQPLGPFLGKSFRTSLAAWITPLEALTRVEGPEQDPPPLPHLRVPEPRALDLDLEAVRNGEVIARVNARRLYWSVEQQLAHAASNGATIRAGDLFGSGTISGWEPGTKGCLLEAGEDFLRDGDEVVLRGSAGTIALGEVRGTVR